MPDIQSVAEAFARSRLLRAELVITSLLLQGEDLTEWRRVVYPDGREELQHLGGRRVELNPPLEEDTRKFFGLETLT